MIIPKDCQECLNGKMNEEWIEITRQEYRKLKSEDKENANKYTARIKHRYYKEKKKYPIEFGDNWFKAIIKENGLTITEDDLGEVKTIWVGKDGSRFRNLKKAMELIEQEDK